MNSHWTTRLNTLLSRLGTRTDVLDQSGRSLLTGVQVLDMPPANIEADECVQYPEGVIRASREIPSALLYAETADIRAADDLFRLIDALAAEFRTGDQPGYGSSDIFRRILNNELSLPELNAAADEYRVPRRLPRCVMLMHTAHAWDQAMLNQLHDILPCASTDILIPVDRYNIALARDAGSLEDRADMREFAQAAQETVLSETGVSMTIGLGGICEDLAGLHHSFVQAQRAIEIGRVFLPDQTIFDYQAMPLQRFLAELPPQTAAYYHRLLFSAENARLFTDELLTTIETFFRKDLNLSDTARQLYIHRNTLTYRLDKIMKVTGLDLRSFDDAVTFKLLMEMKHCAEIRDNQL